MFKIDDKATEQFAERGTNKLIVKLNKNLLKATKVSSKELTTQVTQAIIPEERPEEDIMFKIY
jgi:hypothetical protein